MRLALFASACLFATPAFAQDDRFADVEIEVQEVAPNVAVLFGEGGNIALSHGADGNATPTFMEWQKWLKGAQTEAETAFPARGAEDPIGPDFNPRPYSNAFESFQKPPRQFLVVYCSSQRRCHWIGCKRCIGGRIWFIDTLNDIFPSLEFQLLLPNNIS